MEKNKKKTPDTENLIQTLGNIPSLFLARAKFQLLDIRDYWKNYIFQTFLAFTAVFALLLIMDLRHEVIIASIGATTFIIFAKPHCETARPRHVITGQGIGICCGILWNLILLHRGASIPEAGIYAMAVTTAFLLMTISRTDHPPAAGTALGITITGAYADVMLMLTLCILLLVAIHQTFKDYFRDLF